MQLSDRAYALALVDAHERESVVACVALVEHSGQQSTWPEAFRTAAVGVYNERAEAESCPNPAREVEGRPGSLESEVSTVGRQ